MRITRPFAFIACSALFACRQRATTVDSRTTDPPVIAMPSPDSHRALDAATTRPDVGTSDGADGALGDTDASRADAGPLLINASMGAFSIAHGTPSGGGFGAVPRGPVVNAADPTIVGPLQATSVHLMLNAGQRYFRTCYERSLHGDPRLRGTAVVRAVVGPTGDVLNATVSETTLSDRDVASCVASIFRRSRFASPSEGATAVVTVPFSFETGTP